ncbi:MAG: MBOAT family protein, partial [Clostridiaceae bacterium]|nr:MBOAT family protein [Clostridiaceae bacterium]
KAKNTVLLIFSLFFYAWGEPIWVVLMIITGIMIHWAGLRIDRYRGTRKSKRYLVFAIVTALASLAVFKYSGFAVENINALFGLSLHVPSFSLPIGISFYTFQTLTYAIDLYRGQTNVQKSLRNFLLYEALFPQLIAGPIVRYADIAEQINNRKMTWSGFSKGISRFLIGLAKKVLIANYAGQIVSQTIADKLSGASVLDAWIGIIAFAFQIYFDFSGYSDMAIGLGHLFGFHFKENFRYPYVSASITEFWRRWHISLSTFFRDYVYIPLGGNRRMQVRNMFIVWALTGLWHGASWNFIFWGLYFFLLLFLEKKVLGRFLEKIPRVFGHLYTLFAVLLGWVFFYFTDASSIFMMLRLMFGFSGQAFAGPTAVLLLRENILFFVIAAVASTPFVARTAHRLNPLQLRQRRPALLAFSISLHVLMLFICTASLVGSTYNPFLYFRF